MYDCDPGCLGVVVDDLMPIIISKLFNPIYYH